MRATLVATVFTLGLCASAVSAASSLAEAAPKGVDLSGSWVIDTALSDDPNIALATLRRAIEAQKPPARSRFGRMRRDSSGDLTDAVDREANASTERLLRQMSLDDLNERRAAQMAMFTDMLRNPSRIDIRQTSDGVTLVAGYDHLECVPGERVSVTDSSGTGRRECGWAGAALLVQLKQQRGAVLEQRYELDPAGAQLIFTTRYNADKLPPIALRRTYRRAVAQAALPAVGSSTP